MKRVLCYSLMASFLMIGATHADTAKRVQPKQDRGHAAFLRLQEAARRGNAAAQADLGAMFYYGHGVRQDYAEAVKWWRLAAARGVADAQYNLGEMYADGRGVGQNFPDAVKWWRLAANQGLAGAQLNLGAMYGMGQGVRHIDAVAYALLDRAAASGDDDNAKMAKANRTALASRMTGSQLEEAAKLSVAMARPGNLLKAMDAYVAAAR